jgi:hypothetical protein
MDKSNSYEDHEERRKHPRIIINSPIKIHYKDDVLKARIRNLSPGGLQIRSNNETLQNIYPYDNNLTENNTPDLDVVFNLKFGGMKKEIRACCKMYYSVGLSDESDENIVCGLKFMNFEGESSNQIDDFIHCRNNDFYLVI